MSRCRPGRDNEDRAILADVAGIWSVADFRANQSYAETATRWQSLSYGPTYNAAKSMETIHVSRNTDAADYVAKRFPNKPIR